MKLVFLGPPGAGKGTQAKLLPEFYQISTGEVIRTAFKNKDKILLPYQASIERGELLPDKPIFNLIEQEIKKVPAEYKGYILDGAVRTLPQAKFVLENKLGETFINFPLFETIAKERIKQRRLKENRKEDSPEAVERRFADYNSQNIDILDYLFNNAQKYFEVNASASIESVHNSLLSLLRI